MTSRSTVLARPVVRAPQVGVPVRAIGGEDAKRAGALMFSAYLLLILVEYLGLKNDVPAIQSVRLATVLSYGLAGVALVRIGCGRLVAMRQVQLMAVLIAWTCASILWATVKTYALDSVRPLVDALVFMLATAYVMDRPGRFDKLAFVFAFVVVVLILRNEFALSNTTRTVSFTAGYFMGDGNDFAWGLVVLAPLILGLALGRRRLITRLVGLFGFCVCIFGIMSTQSRGGTLGLAGFLLYGLLFVSRRKALTVAAVTALAVGGLIVAPPGYTDRMRTIDNYEEDNSANARLQVWGVAIRMAVENPLGVGAGNFNSAYGRFYMPGADSNRIAWAPNRWLSAHSIYFKVLGEYGFVGLAVLVWFIAGVFVLNWKNRASVDAANESGAPDWAAVFNMSVVGFAICGVFLGGVTYPHVFLLAGLAIGLSRWRANESRPMPAAVRANGAPTKAWHRANRPRSSTPSALQPPGALSSRRHLSYAGPRH